MLISRFENSVIEINDLSDFDLLRLKNWIEELFLAPGPLHKNGKVVDEG